MRRRALHLACLFTEGHAVCTYRDHHPRPIVTCCNLPLFILSMPVPARRFTCTPAHSGGLEECLGSLGVVETSHDAVGVSMKDFECEAGCPKTPVKGKVPSKGSRRVGPTEVPAMRYPHNHPPALANERSTRCLRRGKKRRHHRENFTGCTRRPCLKRRRGSCPSSPARCRSSPRNVKFHQHQLKARWTRPATYRELRPFRYDL